MKNIAIVTDSSVSFTKEQIKERQLYVVPLTIIYGDQELFDQVNISTEQVRNILLNDELLSTSQPNIGTLIDIFNEIKEKQYDHIFILPLSHHLSGTFNSFKQAVEQVDLNNYTLIETETLVGPVQRAVDLILKLNKEGKSIQEIIFSLNRLFNHTESYVLPKTLKQLKASGRISKSAATMASLLKIKPVLKLENKGTTIEKFATARTENKAMMTIVKDLIKNDITPKTHVLNLLHSEAESEIHTLLNLIEQEIGSFEYNISSLPAVLTVHAGVGTIVLQYTIK